MGNIIINKDGNIINSLNDSNIIGLKEKNFDIKSNEFWVYLNNKESFGDEYIIDILEEKHD